jgi:uroporphyrinogen-III synthase
VSPLIVIRPQPGCDATASAARALGLDARCFPLFSIAPREWKPPPRSSFDALLIGSANVLRHGGEALSGYIGAPTYAVGETTAEAARQAGFEIVAAGRGGMQSLLAYLLPQHRRLLRLTGDLRVDLAPPPDVTITERVVYASEPLAPPPELVQTIGRPAVVLLHSGEAARHFAHLCNRRRIDRSHIALAAIGPRVAAAAGPGWRAVAAAQIPDDAALLALAGQMCHTSAGSDDGQDSA